MQEETITSEHQVIIDKAYLYLVAGLYVLPGQVGKKFPHNGLVPNCSTVSYNIADYPDRMALLDLFKKYTSCNIIALTGNGFGLVSIDIDLVEGKFTPEGLAFIELLKDYPTYIKKTPSSSLQYLYWIDPKRPLVGRRIGYKPGVDILLDGASPMPPSKAFSSKINAVGEYTEDDPIELQPITTFPYELFPDLIDTPENREKHHANKRQRIQEQIDKGEITEYRNDTFHHLSVALAAKFPKHRGLVWDFVKWLYDNRTNKKDFPLSELKTTFDSALDGKIVTESRIEVQEHVNLDTDKFGDPPVVFWNQLQDWKIPETSFLVNNLIVEKGINYIYGKPGVCKTWLAQYLALCIAKGVPAFSKEGDK